MAQENIVITGARAHNLKNIDVAIPRDKLVVLTGLSGSGKSSLAFDTIYAEGQRRYVESLSAYARQFLGQMDKPDVDSIEGLSPAISIDQKTTSRNPRSTVGTVTEIYDYLRLLFARIGRPHCPEHGIEITSPDRGADGGPGHGAARSGRGCRSGADGAGRKGEHAKLLEEIARAGICPRAGRRRDAGARRGDPTGEEQEAHHRSGGRPDRGQAGRRDAGWRIPWRRRSSWPDGQVIVDVMGEEELLFSQNLACPECGFSIDELSPRMFSFNSPYGACPACDGLGSRMEVDPGSGGSRQGK